MANKTATSDEELIAKHIEPNPNKPGADEVRIKGYLTPVWALIGDYRGQGGDIGAVARGYRVPVEVVEAALAYYRKHREIIDNRLAANLA
ncbi:MAG: hypothetical protein ACRDJE_09795 [Dehalococcoidia bacterium]